MQPATRQSQMRRPRPPAFVASCLAIVVGLVLAACGGSGGSGTTYWKANFTNGTTQYMSIIVSGSDLSGWAKYQDGTFQHYNGTVNSDGTYSVEAYDGATLSINGSNMTMTLDGGSGTQHWVQVDQAAYKSAGGP